MSNSSSHHHHQRRRQRRQRSTASTIATTAATVAVAYGTYRFSQWYWKEEDEHECEHECEEGTAEHQHEQRADADADANADANANRRPDRSGVDVRHPSWLSSAVTGVVGWWFTDSPIPIPLGTPVGGTSSSSTSSSTSSNYNHNYNYNRNRNRNTAAAGQRPTTRRQRLVRCRYQTRVAFRNCFPTLRPAIDRLTDASRQTKELKVLRRKRQALRKENRNENQNQNQPEQPEVESSEDDCDGEGGHSSSSSSDPDPAEREREAELLRLQRREEDLWSEILVETTTRMMVSSYAYVLLLLSLTVQFHWLAAEAEARADSGCSLTEEQQRQQQGKQEGFLMKSHRYLLNEGLPLLVSTVRRSVEMVVFETETGNDHEIDANADADTDWDDGRGSRANHNESPTPGPGWTNPSGRFVTREEIELVLYQRLPRVLEDVGIGGRRRGHRRRGRRSRNWIRFVLPDDEAFDPIWDICRSPVWEDAQEQVLGCVWHEVLRDGDGASGISKNASAGNFGWGGVFRPGETIDGRGLPNDNQFGTEHTQQRQPLVKVMARFKKATSLLFEDCSIEDGDNNRAERTAIKRLQVLPTVLELGDVTLQ